MFKDFYNGKRVFITGHTGFKGSWLSEWLLLLGARPMGYSLAPATDPALFNQLDLAGRIKHEIGDIRELDGLRRALQQAQPDIVFHLAAQPLVREAYTDPVTTYQTNVLGTVHLLEALRSLDKPCAVVVITTDKCYENHEWLFGYRENDPLGGHDPYSSSKACAELAVHSFRQSFFNHKDKEDGAVAVASARAGNVMGGGDWARDRIVPDCIRALMKGRRIPVRHPQATRPWQHVLECLSGYLLLAQAIYPGERGLQEDLCGPYNFGPSVEANQTVQTLVEVILKYWPGQWDVQSEDDAPHEAGLLNLNTDKAWHCLGWRPVWDFQTAVKETVQWYQEVMESCLDARQATDLTRRQILAYHNQARRHQQTWAQD